jgi:hypothetical protein
LENYSRFCIPMQIMTVCTLQHARALKQTVRPRNASSFCFSAVLGLSLQIFLLFHSVEHTICQERIQVDFFDLQAIFTTMKLSIFRSCIGMLVLHPVTSFTTLNTLAVRQTLSHARNTNLAMAADPERKKETTWDRITGPKLFKTVTNWEGIHAVPLVPLRIMTGLLMIHHGSEGEFAFQ